MGQGQDNSLSGGYSMQEGGSGFSPGNSAGYNPNSGEDSGSGFWKEIEKALSDPETLKALSKIGSAHAGMGKAQAELPPAGKQILQSGLREYQQQKQREAAPRQIESYMGDIKQFSAGLPPHVAQDALFRLGIPGMIR